MDPIRRTLVFVAAAGAATTAGAFGFFTPKDGLSVALGAALGTLNLWLLAKVGRAMVDTGNKGWAVIGGLKFVALLAIMGFLFRRNVVGALPLLAGFGCLPVGIFLAQLTAPLTDKDGAGADGA